MAAWGRPLTGIETWQWLFDRACTLNLVFVGHLTGPVDAEAIEQGLAAISRRYPTLRARIEDGRPPRFVGDAPAPVLGREPWTPGAWREVALREADTPVPWETGPLMRAVLLEGEDSSDVILNFNHAVADGQSGWTLLTACLRAQAGDIAPDDVAPEMNSPPLGALLAPRWRAAQTAIRSFPKMLRLTPMPVERRVPVSERRTGLIDAELSAAETAALRTAARDHGATVHGAIVAASLLATAKEIRTAKGLASVPMGSGSPVDMRRHAGLAPDAVGNLLSGVLTTHRVDAASELWPAAIAVSREIRRAVDSGDVLALARMQDMASRTATRNPERLLKSGERVNRSAVFITNVGSFEPPERYGDVRLDRAGFLVTNRGIAAANLGACVTTVNGTMSLNYLYCDPLMSAPRARGIVDEILERLRDAAGRPSTVH